MWTICRNGTSNLVWCVHGFLILNMILGVTGNRSGLDDKQRAWLKAFLLKHSPKELHHGDCIGVDAEVHDMVRESLPACKITVHPPTYDDQRAFKKGDKEYPKKHFLVRNKLIVKRCTVLVGFPIGTETLRSGTWSTIREARRKNKPHHIVYPESCLRKNELHNVDSHNDITQFVRP